MMKLELILIFSLALVCSAAQTAFGAACCGGGFAAPSIIAGDDKAQLTTSYSLTEVVVDSVDSQGFWREWDEHQKVQTFKIEGAHIFEDRWQVGFALPIIRRSRQNETYSGLGDIPLSLGYEYLPDWNYNPTRPKGIGFLQITLPTGKSKADSEVGGLDSRGTGFWSLGAGTLLTKILGRWDAFASLEAHRSFDKNVAQASFTGTLKPGFGGNFGIGLGYNLKDYRLGTGITWTYEDPVKSTSSSGSNSPGSVERFATAVASVSYLANEEWSGTINYTDQRLFGSPVNTSLGRGVALQMQRRWGR
jgi:hypothetical protein